MNLQALLNHPGAPDLEIAGLAEHTGELREGFGFIAVSANDDDFSRYCEQAVSAGAVAILCEPHRVESVSVPLPVVGVENLIARRGAIAARFYGEPTSKQTCIGITGTNGKTSVAFHVADLSNHLDVATGYCGTLGWGGLDSLQGGQMTTPNAVALQRLMRQMADDGFERVALEVSSHALDQNRAQEVQFDAAIFTNLSRDHLDYHQTQEAYFQAKARLFSQWPLQVAVINMDDEFGKVLADQTPVPQVSYGKDGAWSWQAEMSKFGADVVWKTPHGQLQARLPVIADFAIANVTAAMVVLVALGHRATDVAIAAGELRPVPGRMEMLPAQAQRPTVIVDFAHTPDALEKALQAASPIAAGKLVCVVGCGGDRDAGKRPMMGAAAAKNADQVWLTSDNPRSEDPQTIIDQTRAGIGPNIKCANDTSVMECVDRAEAIERSIQAAGADDVVLIAGKGHESYQEIGGRKVPFDDRDVARHVLEGLG